MSKFQNLAKLGKKTLKSENSTNYNAMEARPKFLISDAKTALNRLWLAFIEISILRYFDPKSHIWIETNVLGYTISGVLN